jgi:hypothetical protein
MILVVTKFLAAMTMVVYDTCGDEEKIANKKALRCEFSIVPGCPASIFTTQNLLLLSLELERYMTEDR